MKIPPPPKGCYPCCHQTDEEETIKKWLNRVAVLLGIIVGLIFGFFTAEMIQEMQKQIYP